MTKILLVEDDKSLREIYGVRLLAEGYDVVSASDGEQALAMAIKERPALIITDVMMPKISGFDMLDILRSTTETREIKVIVMTALGSDENKDRGERLGADAYLVKSQVGIEDVVRTVHDLLGDAPAGAGATSAVSAAPAQTATTRTAPPTPVPQRTTPVAPAAPSAPTPSPAPVTSIPVTTPPPMPVAPPPSVPPTRTMVSSPAVPPPGTIPNGGISTPPPMPTTPPIQPSVKPAEPPSRRTRVIQPLNDMDKKPNLQDLVEKELAKEGGITKLATADEEREQMNNQINDFIKSPATTPPVESTTLPPVNTTTPPPENLTPTPTTPAPSNSSEPSWPNTPSAPGTPPNTPSL